MLILVAMAAALTTYGVVTGVSDGWNIPNTILLVVWRGGFAAVVFLWPSIRSLRRWDQEHQSLAATRAT